MSDPNVSPFTIYAAEKALAEKAVWEFVDKHPHVEMTASTFFCHGTFSISLTMSSVAPTFFYGPFAPAHKSPFEGEAFNAGTISTMEFFYGFIRQGSPAPPLWWIDVRDVARSLVAALTAPPTFQVGRKRILISSDYVDASDVADLIRKERPQLAHRVSKDLDSAPKLKQIVFNERFREVLNFELVPWKKSILDGVDALVQLEDFWKAQGKPIGTKA